jgi:Cu2+-exporting ATPase
VATAVLVVTCPCAFGIATPLGYDLAQGGLRKAGLYVRSAGFLDRAASVRTVVFDKTGTLTLGKLGVRASHEVRPLDATSRARLVEACAANGHPKASAIREWAEREGYTSKAGLEPGTVHEVPGKGLELATDEGTYRFGLPSWAAAGNAQRGDVCFARDGAALAWFSTEEALRAGARDEIRALREEGYDVWLLSGDEAARTAQTARFAGIPEDHAVGGATPTAKADWVAAHDREDLLMIGDGINDSLVVERAFCGGTPAVDRPFMAARSDFYFTTPGLGCIRLALRVGKAVTQVRRRNLVIAVAYNLLCVGLAYAGLLSPLACAVLMPVSSLTTILGTSVTLSSKSPLWKSSPSKSS